MIPVSSGFLPQNFKMGELPDKTYSVDFEAKRIRGFTDGIGAVALAVFKILNTERYQYPIYSWDYGIETTDLYGRESAYVMSELKRRISEALLWDSRIEAVEDFEFSSEKGKIACRFTVNTAFGAVDAEKEISV